MYRQNFHEFSERNKALEAEKTAMAQHVAGLKGKMARYAPPLSLHAVNPCGLKSPTHLTHAMRPARSVTRRVRNGASKRLVDLSIDVRNAKAALQERLDLATRLLQLAEKGRQLETDREKVQPYYQSSIAAEGAGASEEDAKQVRAPTSAVAVREVTFLPLTPSPTPSCTRRRQRARMQTPSG